RELRADLVGRGHRFVTQSDTEVIVHLYEDRGIGCLELLNGMFALALWDRNTGSLLLARDRLGIKPLVYRADGPALMFASEIGAILAGDDAPCELDKGALDRFFTYLYVSAPATMFHSIKKLPPGHCLIYRNGNSKVRPYWSLKLEESPSPLSREDCLEQARGLLREAVQMRMISDVPIGAFLSGGMDSAAVVAFMSDVSSGPVKTFTIGYGEEDASYNEFAEARLVAEHFGTDHREFVLRPHVVDVLPRILEATGEPFADSSAIPTYLVSREARKHVTVALSGIGGDEVFMGYPRYLGARLSTLYARLPLWLRRNVMAPMADRLPESTASGALAGRAKRFIQGSLTDPVNRYLQWISYSSEEMKRALYDPAFLQSLKGCDSAVLHRSYLSAGDGSDYLRRISHLDLMTYLPHDLLFMGDAMSMAHSLELRVPFCDHKLVEFMVALSPEQKMKGMHLKGLLKEMMRDRLPAAIMKKRKQGFMVPLGAWLQKSLRGYLRETLLSARFHERGFFNAAHVERMVDEHLQGTRLWTHQLWSLLTFEVWCQHYLDRPRGVRNEMVLGGAF
ncbi:MAG: asparagine synthase (glutamine-hydrolyzing), partial [bacterium]|nr:asparagine synthase (glutamine-hydrolyzing) [bacterium]